MSAWREATGHRIVFREEVGGELGVQLVKDSSFPPAPLGRVPGARLNLEPASPWRLLHDLGHVIGLTDAHLHADRDEYLELEPSRCGAEVGDPALPKCGEVLVRRVGGPARPRTASAATGYRSVMAVPSDCSGSSCDVSARGGGTVHASLITRGDVGAVVSLYAEELGWQGLTPAVDGWPFAGRGLTLVEGVELQGLPALAARAGKVLSAARGEDGNLYWQADARGKSPWQLAPAPGLAETEPSVVTLASGDVALASVVGGQLLLGVGPDLDVLDWQDWGRPVGEGELSAPSLGRCGEELRAYVRLGERLYSRGITSLGLQEWRVDGNAAVDGRPAVAAYDDSRLDVVIRATTGDALFHYVWFCSHAAAAWDYLIAAPWLESAVAIASPAPSLLSVFVVERSGVLMEKRFAPGLPWQDFRPIAGSVSARGVSAASDAGALHIAIAISPEIPEQVRAASDALFLGRWLDCGHGCTAQCPCVESSDRSR